LATGSRPFVPPIEGIDLPGVFVYRTLEDLEAIARYARQCNSAAVLGGGLLGLEAAKAIYDLGLESHVVEMAPGLMPRQLNAEAANLLAKEITSLGVSLHLLKRTSRIANDRGKLRIEFTTGEPLVVDMIIVSAGIRPRDELADSSELVRGERGGFAVDERLRTNDPRISAVGECASFNGKIYGLVGPCYRMAQVLADNLAALATGKSLSATFSGASEAAQLKLMGVEVCTLGMPLDQQHDCVLLCHEGAASCRTLMLRGRQVVGAIGVGPWPERDSINQLIVTGRRLSNRQLRRFERTGDVGPTNQRAAVADWPEAAMVCSCVGVTRGELSAALTGGASSLDGLIAATGASTVCGSCRPLLAALVGVSDQSHEVAGWRALLVASVLALCVVAGYVAVEPMPFAETVSSGWHRFDVLWRDSFAKQVTGFSLLAITAMALLFSLRKRWSKLSIGDFGIWRSMHGILGLLTLVGFLVHTGLHLGSNLTLVLAFVFLAINLLGSATGVVAALESSCTGAAALVVRRWRPRLTRMHIWLFWPLPVLVLFHVISVYYY
jgi:nitrite reductase (NADH) large subunit